MGIRLSDKHGANPSVELCYFCMEAKGVVFLGRLQGDAEAPRETCVNMEPCEKCKGYMKQGIILISVADGQEPTKDPYRTGSFIVVKEDFIIRTAGDNHPAMKARFCFIEDTLWDQIGLPRGPIDGQDGTDDRSFEQSSE